MRLRTSLAAAGLLSMSQQSPGQSPPVTVEYRTVCRTCRIELSKVMTFGLPSDPKLVSGRTPARDSRGRYFAAAAGEAAVLVFDSTGKYQTAIGRAGDGPGEFSRRISRLIVGPGDSLYVFHGAARVEVFSPDLRYVRRVMLPAPDDGFPLTVAVLPTGFILHANILTPERIGLPLHVLTATGEVIRSFNGTSSRPILQPSDLPLIRMPIVASNDARSFWVTTDTGFTLQQWSVEGTLLRSIRVTNAPWMRPVVYYDTTVPGRASTGPRRLRLPRPHATVRLAGIDDDGRLWLASRVPGNGDPGNGHPLPFAMHVFDPRTLTFVHSQPMTEPLTFVSPGHSVSLLEDANGILSFAVSKVVFRGG